MKTPKDSLDPSLGLTVALTLLLALAWSVVVIRHPLFIEHLELKLADAIVATAPDLAMSDGVVVVEIDEQSLATWGQWPWPRSRLACLLTKLSGLGAKSIASVWPFDRSWIANEDRRPQRQPQGPKKRDSAVCHLHRKTFSRTHAETHSYRPTQLKTL